MDESLSAFKCPYCDRQSASPGGVRFHVKLTHREKLDEFNEQYYAAMDEVFQRRFDK